MSEQAAIDQATIDRITQAAILSTFEVLISELKVGPLSRHNAELIVGRRGFLTYVLSRMTLSYQVIPSYDCQAKTQHELRKMLKRLG